MNTRCINLTCALTIKRKNQRDRSELRQPSAMRTEDDDEEGFGDFNFAPFSVRSNLKINGSDLTVNDDDDWGDFVKSAGLSRSESIPAKSIDPFSFFIDLPNDNSQRNDAVVPDTAPTRIQWMKPKGALPLSIFGEAEKEEEEGGGEKSSSAGVLFNAATEVKKDKKSGLNVTHLISDLYKQSEQSENDDGNKMDSEGADLNLKNLSSDELDLKGSVSNLDSKELNWGAQEDGGWEFRVAELKLPAGDFTTKSDVQVKTENTPKSNLNWFNSSWDVLGSDLNGASSNLNENVNANRSSSLVNETDDFGDDDGWEFKVAESETETGASNSKVNSKALDNPEGVKHSFGFGNSTDVSTGLFVPSDGISKKSGGLDFDFDFSKSFVTPNGISSNSFSDGTQKDDNKNGLNCTPVNGNADVVSQKSGGLDFGFDFRTSSMTPNGISSNSFSDSKKKDDTQNGQTIYPVKGNVDSDLFAASGGISQKSSGLDFGFDFSTSSMNSNGSSSNSFSDSKLKDDNKIGLNSTLVNENAHNGESFGAFKDAFSETGTNDKGNKLKMENHKGALPLSFFGEGENETNDSLVYQDALTSNPVPSIKESTKKSFGSNIPISDLISSLYSQPEQNTSVNHTQSDNHMGSTQTVVDSNLIDGDGDFDDDSWEFKDAFSGTKGENQTSSPTHGDSHMKYSTKMERKDFEDFYSKLKDELCFVVQCHLDNLKKAGNTAALGGEDVEVKALDKEIEDIYHELLQHSIISGEPHSENHSTSNICLDKFVEAVQDPKFHALESEYHLSKRLSLAEKDWRPAIELLRHATSTLKILTLGSKEEQCNYVSTWFRIVSICAQELRHGASIWEQALEKNIRSQVLSDPRGKQHILSLGEIYRAVEVLGFSTKLYKPWVVLSYADPTSMFTLLNECSNLWSSSGLEEAVQNISDPTGFGYNGTPKELLESVKFIHDLDAISLHNNVSSGQEPTCQLSLLTTGTVPGLKTVVWSEEHYFLTLANLWANLISIDPPSLPHLHVG